MLSLWQVNGVLHAVRALARHHITRVADSLLAFKRPQEAFCERDRCAIKCPHDIASFVGMSSRLCKYWLAMLRCSALWWTT